MSYRSEDDGLSLPSIKSVGVGNNGQGDVEDDRMDEDPLASDIDDGLEEYGAATGVGEDEIGLRMRLVQSVLVRQEIYPTTFSSSNDGDGGTGDNNDDAEGNEGVDDAVGIDCDRNFEEDGAEGDGGVDDSSCAEGRVVGRSQSVVIGIGREHTALLEGVVLPAQESEVLSGGELDNAVEKDDYNVSHGLSTVRVGSIAGDSCQHQVATEDNATAIQTSITLDDQAGNDDQPSTGCINMEVTGPPETVPELQGMQTRRSSRKSKRSRDAAADSEQDWSADCTVCGCIIHEREVISAGYKGFQQCHYKGCETRWVGFSSFRDQNS